MTNLIDDTHSLVDTAEAIVYDPPTGLNVKEMRLPYYPTCEATLSTSAFNSFGVPVASVSPALSTATRGGGALPNVDASANGVSGTTQSDRQLLVGPCKWGKDRIADFRGIVAQLGGPSVSGHFIIENVRLCIEKPSFSMVTFASHAMVHDFMQVWDARPRSGVGAVLPTVRIGFREPGSLVWKF